MTFTLELFSVFMNPYVLNGSKRTAVLQSLGLLLFDMSHWNVQKAEARLDYFLQEERNDWTR